MNDASKLTSNLQKFKDMLKTLEGCGPSWFQYNKHIDPITSPLQWAERPFMMDSINFAWWVWLRAHPAEVEKPVEPLCPKSDTYRYAQQQGTMRFKVQGTGTRDKTVSELLNEFFDAHGCRPFYTVAATTAGQVQKLDKFNNVPNFQTAGQGVFRQECKATISESPCESSALGMWKLRALSAEKRLEKLKQRHDRQCGSNASMYVRLRAANEKLTRSDEVFKAVEAVIDSALVNLSPNSSRAIKLAIASLRVSTAKFDAANNK